MIKKIVVIFLGTFLGIGAGLLLLSKLAVKENISPTPIVNFKQKREVLGFLPYWFLDSARNDYSTYITTLAYFSLTIDKDGTIMRSTSPAELEPGYYALTGGKLDPFLENAKAKQIKLSLVVFSGDQDVINELISDPINHADNLVNDITPIMKQYGFSDLNIDVEPTGTASSSSAVNYTSFVSEVSKQIKNNNLGSVSIDMIPVDFIRNDHMARPSEIEKYVDTMIIMAYDFHSPGSFVTGPVAPIYGAGTVAEFDTQVTVNAALRVADASKILLGIPFYGYSWETIEDEPRSAIVPSSAIIESNKDLEDFLAKCATCESKFDDLGQESYLIYKNQDSGTFQQIFYPDERSVTSKINFIKGNNLGGVAIWALGYEGSKILNPIQKFLSGR